MIIPRSPSPTLPIAQGDSLRHLSDTEIRRLARERLQIVKVRRDFRLPLTPVPVVFESFYRMLRHVNCVYSFHVLPHHPS